MNSEQREEAAGGDAVHRTGLSVIDRVLLDLHEHFADLDDMEGAPFGEYARVTRGVSSLTVLHESEPWGIEIIVRPTA